MSELYHARRRSKYKGGFKTVNGRKNNTAEYNHDYYTRNRERWRKKYNKVQDWLGYDERDEIKITKDLSDEADRWYESDKDWVNEMIIKGHHENNQELFNLGIDFRDYDWGYKVTANNAYHNAISKYEKTPLGMLENISNKVSSAAQDIAWAVEDGADVVKKFANDTISEIDYQIWRLGKAIKKKRR